MAQTLTMVRPGKARGFSVREYDCMLDVGVLSSDERVELLDGKIICMPPMYSPHAAAIRRLTDWFAPRITERASISVQCPIDVSSRSQPEPDFALLEPRSDSYEASHPTPQDVLLLVEVGDSSRRRDERRKLPLYARAGITELWLVDLRSTRLTVYRSPRGAAYQDVSVYGPDDAVTLLAFPDLTLPLRELFGSSRTGH